MRQPARSCSRRGLLLVEAALAAAVMGVGLLFISRSLSSQLSALKSVEAHETLLALARGKLLELEGVRVFRPPSVDDRPDGTFDAPYGAYEWEVAASLRQDESGESPTSLLRVTVRRSDRASSNLTLSAIWPTAQVPAAWF